MINSGFINSDTVICKKHVYFSNGDIAVVAINGDLVLRIIYNKDNVIIAKTNNNIKNFDTVLTSESQVVGKIIGLVRKISFRFINQDFLRLFYSVQTLIRLANKQYKAL